MRVMPGGRSLARGSVRAVTRVGAVLAVGLGLYTGQGMAGAQLAGCTIAAVSGVVYWRVARGREVTEVDRVFGVKCGCEACGAAVCFTCTSRWHPGQKVGAAAASALSTGRRSAMRSGVTGDCATHVWQCGDVSDGLLADWWRRGRDVAVCPRCLSGIERSDGCNHMTCRSVERAATRALVGM